MDRTSNLLKSACGRLRRDWREYRYMLLFIGLMLLLIHHIFGSLCPMQVTIGIPCPGCGLTRACILWLKGEPALATQMHPLALPAMLLIAAYPMVRYLFPGLEKSWSIAVLIWGGLLILLYIYRMSTMFPDTEPMCYYDGILREWVQTIIERRLT